MTSTKALTTSERYARLVLSAWNNREFTELKGLLAQPVNASTDELPSEERERMDLIQDVGRSLLIWKNSGPGKNAGNVNVALALVRHLARYDEETGMAEVTSKSAPPLEMPASVPHLEYAH
jgi:hypothetical protein